LKELPDGVGRQLDDVDTNARASRDQAAFEALQRLAQRSAADAKAAGQIGFG
jgi:hypothetical protein